MFYDLQDCIPQHAPQNDCGVGVSQSERFAMLHMLERIGFQGAKFIKRL